MRQNIGRSVLESHGDFNNCIFFSSGARCRNRGCRVLRWINLRGCPRFRQNQLAERVLGNVISSGIRVLVLSVIVGIGSTLFAQFTATGLAAGGVVVAGVASAGLAAGAAGGAALAYRAGGMSGVAEAGASSVIRPLRRAAAALRESSGSASAAGTNGEASTGAESGGAAASASSYSSPSWATRMKRSQTASHGVSAATQAVRSGDHGGGGSSVNLSEGDR